MRDRFLLKLLSFRYSVIRTSVFLFRVLIDDLCFTQNADTSANTFISPRYDQFFFWSFYFIFFFVSAIPVESPRPYDRLRFQHRIDTCDKQFLFRRTSLFCPIYTFILQTEWQTVKGNVDSRIGIVDGDV